MSSFEKSATIYLKLVLISFYLFFAFLHEIKDWKIRSFQKNLNNEYIPMPCMLDVMEQSVQYGTVI